MKNKLCPILFILMPVLIFANPFDMVLSDDPVIEDIRFISLVTGELLLSYTPPFSLDEIEIFLHKIDPDTLNSSAYLAYKRIENRLNPKAAWSYSLGYFTLNADIAVTLEGRVRLNTDDSWKSNYNKIQPILSFPIRFHFADALQLYIDPVIRLDPKEYGTGTFDHNIPLGYDYLDNSMPHRAFGAFGGAWWNFQIGRDLLYWGSANTGSLTFNANSYYTDYARLSLFSKRFKYSFVVNHLPIGQDASSLADKSIYNPYDWNNNNYLKKTTQRYFYLHRLDFSLFKKFSMGIMEGIMVADSALELRYLNPISVFHSFFAWRDYGKWDPVNNKYPGWGDMIGSFFSIEINYNIIKSLSVYGQFVMNEFATPGEKSGGSLQPPNALGYLAGAQYSLSFNDWISVFYLEFIYTDPYLYILSTPFGSFIQVDTLGNTYFLGYPRDTIALTLGTRFFNNDNLILTGRFSWICKGEKDKSGILWDWDLTHQAANASTPTGISEHKIILSMGAEWRIFSFLKLGGDITGIIAVNNNHNSGNSKTGAQFSLSVTWEK